MRRVAVAVLLAVVCGCGQSRPAAGEAAEVPGPASPVRVGARQLWMDYGGDQTAADGRYRERYLVVTGEVHSITPDGDGVSLNLICNGSGEARTEVGVLARFPADRRATLTVIRSGDSIELRGLCIGKRPGERFPNGYAVALEDCELPAPGS
jgi:hypothetical protein